MADLNKDTLPTRANIYVWKGDYVEFGVDFVDADGNAPDLTGYVGKADIVQNGNVVGTFDVAVDSEAGKLIVSLESPASASLVPGIYAYDLQMVQSATGRVRTFQFGQVIVRGETTLGI